MSRLSFALTIAVLFGVTVVLSILALQNLFAPDRGNEDQAEATEGRTQATETTEETTALEEETTALDETTALEGTTAFQPPEGTRTSSKARIACLRQKEGDPPPTKGTEALNDGVLT